MRAPARLGRRVGHGEHYSAMSHTSRGYTPLHPLGQDQPGVPGAAAVVGQHEVGLEAVPVAGQPGRRTDPPAQASAAAAARPAASPARWRS